MHTPCLPQALTLEQLRGMNGTRLPTLNPSAQLTVLVRPSNGSQVAWAHMHGQWEDFLTCLIIAAGPTLRCSGVTCVLAMYCRAGPDACTFCIPECRGRRLSFWCPPAPSPARRCCMA